MLCSPLLGLTNQTLVKAYSLAHVYSGTPLRPKSARVEPHTHTKRHAGNFLWSLASGMTRGRVRTYVAFHDILTCSNFRAASSQWRASNRVSLLTRDAQATRSGKITLENSE